MSNGKRTNSQNVMKKQLENIWNEVQTNLPEINFENSAQNDEINDFELIETNGDFNIEELEDFDELADVRDKDWSDAERQLQKFMTVHDHDNFGKKSNADIRSIRDIYLDDDDDDDDIQSAPQPDLKELKTFTSKINSNKSEGAQSAQRITKNIFESTNSKLNMDIFNNINFDEMLNNVNNKNLSLSARTDDENCYLRGVGTTSQNTLKDEAVLKKLAEMSSNILNNEKDKDVFNIDFKTGAVLTTTRCSSYTNKGLNSSTQNQNSKESLKKSMDSTHIKNSSINLIETQLGINSEQTMKRNLNKFLKEHNIKDGNMVETRRIDLRAAQEIKKTNTNSKPVNPVEAFLAMQVNYPDQDKNGKNEIRFLNDNDESSSESDSSDEDEVYASNGRKLFGIELYRHQKLNAMKKASGLL